MAMLLSGWTGEMAADGTGCCHSLYVSMGRWYALSRPSKLTLPQAFIALLFDVLMGWVWLW